MLPDTSEAVSVKICKRKANYHVPTLVTSAHKLLCIVCIGLLKNMCIEIYIYMYWNWLIDSNEIDIILHFPLLIYHEYQMNKY